MTNKSKNSDKSSEVAERTNKLLDQILAYIKDIKKMTKQMVAKKKREKNKKD